MKKTLFIAIFTAVLAVSPVAYAQQETTSGSDIQSQQSGSYYQDPANGQQDTAELYETGGNDVLTNTQVENLEVSNDASTNDSNEPKSTLGWVFIAVLFFAGLMMPALLYARDINKKQPKADESSKKSESKPTTSKVDAKDKKEVKKSDVKVSVKNEKSVDDTPKKKPVKKKSSNKAKKLKRRKSKFSSTN